MGPSRINRNRESPMAKKLEVKKNVVKQLTAEELQTVVGAFGACSDSD
jgi:hypothetical protein